MMFKLGYRTHISIVKCYEIFLFQISPEYVSKFQAKHMLRIICIDTQQITY